MKLLKSLPARLLLGIVIGIIAGLIVPEFVMVIIVTVKYILGQLITFSVPLIIIGFIAPSITKLGANATRLLSVALGSAYVSSIGAAVLSMIAGYLIIPHLNITGSADMVHPLPDIAFQLDIPQIMPVMSVLVLSTLLGLAAVFAPQDSFGTACNITGDGALTLILSGYADKHHIASESIGTVDL
jgi:Na+/H+-dicarboxylate symporter